MNKNQLQLPRSLKSDTPKTITFILGAVYVLGFLVVTFYLSQFGVTINNWLQIQYLLAGFWCLIPLIVFVLALAFTGLELVAPWIKYSLDVPKRTRNYRFITGSIEGVAVLIASFIFITEIISWLATKHYNMSWSSALITLKLFGLLLAAVILMVFGFVNLCKLDEVATRNKDRIDRQISILSLNLLFAAAGIYIFLIYIWFFSITIYAVIPGEYGGGKPETVAFILSKGQGQNYPIKADASGYKSIPYKLLLQTDNYYIVEGPSKQEKNIEISKDLVNAMIVLNM